MKLVKVDYSSLNPRQKEIFNFQKVAGLLSDYGFNCIKLADDWQGADFLAYHVNGSNTLKVQLKSRTTVSRMYDESIYMAFPIRGTWYLIQHAELLRLVKIHTNWLETSSWQKGGKYHSANPNPELVSALEKCRIN